jgi:hypothetical protein
MEVNQGLCVFIKDRITISDFQHVMEKSAKAYCLSRLVYYDDTPLDWHNVNTGSGSAFEPRFSMYLRIIPASDLARNEIEESAERSEDDTDQDEYDGTKDIYRAYVFNANVRPGAAIPDGRPGLFVSFECDPADGHYDVVISRTLYTNDV